MGVVKLSTAGIVNYQKYDDFLAGNAAFQPAGNAYEWLETTVLGSDTADVTFANLNTNYGSTYQHLQLRIASRGNRSFTNEPIHMQFNGDTGSNYAWHQLYGNGSQVLSYAESSVTVIRIGSMSANTSSANIYGATIIDILDPFETSKNTTARGLSGYAQSGDNEIALRSGLWNNTAALTSIKLIPWSSTTFETGSRFSLYGLRSA